MSTFHNRFITFLCENLIDEIVFFLAGDHANGTLYMDDGETYKYRDENDYAYWGFHFKKYFWGFPLRKWWEILGSMIFFTRLQMRTWRRKGNSTATFTSKRFTCVAPNSILEHAIFSLMVENLKDKADKYHLFRFHSRTAWLWIWSGDIPNDHRRTKRLRHTRIPNRYTYLVRISFLGVYFNMFL